MADKSLNRALSAEVIAPSDTVNFSALSTAIYVGTGGRADIVLANGAVIPFLNIPSGTTVPIQAKRVNSTNVSASNMVCLF